VRQIATRSILYTEYERFNRFPGYHANWSKVSAKPLSRKPMPSRRVFNSSGVALFGFANNLSRVLPNSSANVTVFRISSGHVG